MAEGRGGYRRPSKPAAVSGPGSMSQRTDGRQPARYMAGGEYGEGQEMMELQTSAPMSEATAPSPSRGRGGSRQRPSGPPVNPLFSPTERPDEPITAGAPFGEGPGPVTPPVQPKPNNLEAVVKYMPDLVRAASSPNAPERFRALVRYLQGV
jgi:hypothetical protein